MKRKMQHEEDESLWNINASLTSCTRYVSGSNGHRSKVKKKIIKSLHHISTSEKKSLPEILSLDVSRCIYAANVIKTDTKKCMELFSEYGQVEDVQVPMQKPFIFVKFKDSISAQAARKALHCRVCEEFLNQMIFIEYAKQDHILNMDENIYVQNALSIRSHKKLPFIPYTELKNFGWCWAKSCPAVPGLLIITDFISEDEEKNLVDFCENQPYDEKQLRHVQHYGYIFDYKTNLPVKKESDGPLFPSAFDTVLNRMKDNIPTASTVDYPQVNSLCKNNVPLIRHIITTKLMTVYHDNIDRKELLPLGDIICDYLFDKKNDPIGFIIDQITVNKYQPGHGIPRHFDTHSAFTDAIMSLSLSGEVVMEFRLYPSRVPINRDEPLKSICIALPRRSLLVMSGDARYVWMHGIHARNTDVIDSEKVSRQTRISFTCRHVLSNPKCNCKYEQYCDSVNTSAPDAFKKR